MRGALLAGVLAAESLRDGDQACATAETFYASGPGDGPVDANFYLDYARAVRQY